VNGECTGCGASLAASAGQSLHDRYNSSPECWELFGELSAYTLSHGDPRFIHQHAVDTWQLQHAMVSKSNIGIAFSLIGLYLALEKGCTGRQVQLAHMELGRTKRNWGDFEIPSSRAALTVVDVLRADPGPARDGELMQWAAAVWANWNHAYAWSRETCAKLLPSHFTGNST
jgi:hypothetical protein